MQQDYVSDKSSHSQRSNISKREIKTASSFVEVKKEAERLYPEFVREIRKQFPYKIPSNYTQWDILSAIGVVECSNIDPTSLFALGKEDQQPLYSFMWREWLSNHCPLYCITNELLELFHKTDIDLNKLIPTDWKPPVPLFLLCFPDNSIKSSDGGYYSHCFVGTQDNVVACSNLDSNFRTTAYFLPFKKEESILASVERSKIANTPLSKEEVACGGKILDAIQSYDLTLIGIQCAIAIAYAPGLIEEEVIKESGIGFKPQKSRGVDNQKPKILHPRWIGRNFQRQRSQPLGGTHSSPLTHWRRGHWRQQACGEKSRDRKLVWIRPVLVASEND